MHRIRTSAALTFGLLGSFLVASPSTAQEAPTASVDPGSGVPGDEVTVRGTGCKHKSGKLGRLNFGFRTLLDDGTTDMNPMVDIRVGPTGAWVSTLAIPERIRSNGNLHDVVAGEYEVTAICVFDEPYTSDDWIPYDSMPFLVTGPDAALPSPSDPNKTPSNPGTPPAAPGDSSSLTATPGSTPSPAVPIKNTPEVTG
jgi:hypothetical protein